MKMYAQALRAFFHYAEQRGWCAPGLAAAIMSPCMFSNELLPSGPSWEDVQRLLGPHSLRHACATRLLAEGLSMKEIGDHLGHRQPDSTRVYAKVDLNSLRQVADFDLGGVRKLFNATTAACPKGLCKLEPHTLRTILILLYGAGLRVSEALGLTLADVDLAAALLIIRETKFHKTRMVPLGADLHQVLASLGLAFIQWSNAM